MLPTPGFLAHASMRSRAPIVAGLAALTLAIGPANSRATTTYDLLYQGADHTTSVPALLNLTWSDGVSTYTNQGYALPGRVRADALAQSPGASGNPEMRAATVTNDFVITGPAGPATVSATMYFMLHLDLEHSGGGVGNSAENASGWFTFGQTGGDAPVQVTGDAFSGNGSVYYGHGALSSYAGGSVDMPVSFTATFPVGTPFAISMAVDAAGQTYGCVCPSTAEGVLAGEIADALAHVMDLPAGYTVNSPSWGVVNNVSTGAVAGVPAFHAEELAFSSVAPNPSTGSARLSYTLPRAGEVSLAILDLQGRIVRTIAAGTQGPGVHGVVWDGRDDSGRAVSQGLYFARLGFEGRVLTRRLTRLE